MTHDTSATCDARTQARVRWRERQVLRWRDLAAEQDHRLAQRRRHDRGVHEWGIVRGLSLAEDAGTFVIEPGVAVDGFGRTIVVHVPNVVPAATVDRVRETVAAEAVDVWLLYGGAAVHDHGPAGRTSQGPTRWREHPRVRLHAVCDADEVVDGRRPVEVPSADLPFGPERTAPDDPQREWPVYLGRLSYAAGVYDISVDHRPQVGLTGEVVVSPPRDARLQVGSERAGDQLRFVVSAGEPLEERLAIDRHGRTELHADISLAGGLRMAAVGGSASALRIAPLGATPEQAAPGQLYRVQGDDESPIDDVRLEIASPGDEGDPSRYRFAVGLLQPTGRSSPHFVPCLTVDAGCVVRLRGTLRPCGLVVQGPAQADPSDPRFVNEVLSNWLQALTDAGVTLDAFYSAGLRARIEGFPTGPVIPDGPVEYSVSVTNQSQSHIRDVTVAESMAIDGETEAGPTQIDGPLTISPQQTMTTLRDATAPDIPGPGTLTVLVAAAGFGRSDEPVLALASRSVQIGEVPA